MYCISQVSSALFHCLLDLCITFVIGYLSIYPLCYCLHRVCKTGFVSTLYVYKWWKFLDEAHIIDILRYAVYLRNLAKGE